MGDVVFWGLEGFPGPGTIPDGKRSISVKGALGHAISLQVDGTVVAWGDNGGGQCNVPEGLIATAVGAGLYTSLAAVLPLPPPTSRRRRRAAWMNLERPLF